MRIIILLIFSLNSLLCAACCEINLVINQGQHNPISIAINNFQEKSTEYSEQITKIIQNDLVNTGLFKVVPKQSFIEDKTGTGHMPLFASWKVIKADILVNGEVILKKDNDSSIDGRSMEVKFVVWDVARGINLATFSAKVDTKNLRSISHRVSDLIYENVIGDKGYFNTRIVYVSETGTRTNRIKRIAIMDQDGHNNTYITPPGGLSLTPRISPQSDKILYLSFKNRTPRVYIHNLKTGQDKILGRFEGISFAPRFSPDGNKVVMSIAKNGITDIYTFDLRNGQILRLTKDFAINTSPSYSPDGKTIFFNSDRSGRKQIYKMNSDGTNIQRISFCEGSYSAPLVSPNGDYVAFSKFISSEGFFIGYMTIDGKKEKLIAKGFLTDGPTWSPNGRMIMFSKEILSPKKTVKTRIYAVDINGLHEREIPTTTDASDPEWTPLPK
jgi:TolB protein